MKSEKLKLEPQRGTKLSPEEIQTGSSSIKYLGSFGRFKNL